jgi:hypothetical protein
VRRHAVAAVVTLLALAPAAPALAYLCHKDPPGTRAIAFRGVVDSYEAHGMHALIHLRTPSGCRTAVWNAKNGASLVRRDRCTARAAARQLAAAPAQDRAPRLRGWPLPVRARTVAWRGEFAVFSGVGSGGLYALRLRDGRFGVIGPNRSYDVPQLVRHGVFYQDDEFKREARRGIVRMKFVSNTGIASIIRRAQQPLTTRGRIAALSMDGPRVALAVANPNARCDRVLYWNVAWRPVQRISAPDGPTCAPRARTAISAVAVGGFRAVWLRSSGAEQALVAGSPLCQEWIVRRLSLGPGGDTVDALAADGSTLAFAITRHERESRGDSTVAVVSNRFRAVDIASGTGPPQTLAVDRSRIAIVRADGVAEIRDAHGALLDTLYLGRVDAVALRGDTLLAVKGTRLDQYLLSTGARVRSWHFGATVLGIDVHYGIAVATTAHKVFAINVQSGRRALLGHAPARIVGAQIEAPGVAFAYNRAVRGVARFIPLAMVERELR